jgi:hypothetical protein
LSGFRQPPDDRVATRADDDVRGRGAGERGFQTLNAIADARGCGWLESDFRRERKDSEEQTEGQADHESYF